MASRGGAVCACRAAGLPPGAPPSTAIGPARWGSWRNWHACTTLRRRAGADYRAGVAPDRFVCEAALDELARRLRFLGFDVHTHRGARLEDLLADAERSGRIVLTTSRRHPRRWRDVRVLVVDPRDPAQGVRAVAAAYEPASRPFERCPRCNTALAARTAVEARGEVPPRVTRSGRPLKHCPGCGQWYWEGSHVARIRDWLEAALGRPIGPGPDAPGAGSPN